MTENDRSGGRVDVRSWAKTTREKTLQRDLGDLLKIHDVPHHREVWFRPMRSISVLDTQSNARQVDFYIAGNDDDYGPFTVALELKIRRDSGIYKMLRDVGNQLRGARAGFGWFTVEGERLPAPDWPVYSDQYMLAGVTAPQQIGRPEAQALQDRLWWQDGCGTMFRDWRGLMVRVPTQGYTRAGSTPDVKYVDLRVCE